MIVGLPTENRDCFSKLLKGLSGLTRFTKCQHALVQPLVEVWNEVKAELHTFLESIQN